MAKWSDDVDEQMKEAMASHMKILRAIEEKLMSKQSENEEKRSILIDEEIKRSRRQQEDSDLYREDIAGNAEFRNQVLRNQHAQMEMDCERLQLAKRSVLAEERIATALEYLLKAYIEVNVRG